MQNLKLLSVSNILGFIVVILLNTLANALPIAGRNTGEISDLYPSLFTPAGFTFSIWGLIYLLLLCFVVYQSRVLWTKETPLFLKQIGWWFFISCAANALWILAWHHLHTGLAMILMLVILFSLIKIYTNLEIGRRSTSTAERYLVHLPFSVYLAWITVATIANFSILLIDLGWNGGENPQIWTVAVLITAVIIGWILIWNRRDPAYLLVLIWAFWGILYKRSLDTLTEDRLIEITLYIGIAALIAGVIWSFLRKNNAGENRLD